MRKISEIFNFDDIGGKIKNYAQWSCWITIMLIWIAAPIICIILAIDYIELCWIPLVGAVVCPLLVWIGSWLLYALGEFVEDTHAIRNRNYPELYSIHENVRIMAMPMIREAEEKAKYAAEQRAKNAAERKAQQEERKREKQAEEAQNVIVTDDGGNRYWICGKCKTKNQHTRNKCWYCDNPK